MATQHLALLAYAQLSDADEAALTDLYRRGTPANTLCAWERDLAYVAAWKYAASTPHWILACGLRRCDKAEGDEAEGCR